MLAAVCTWTPEGTVLACFPHFDVIYLLEVSGLYEALTPPICLDLCSGLRVPP